MKQSWGNSICCPNLCSQGEHTCFTRLPFSFVITGHQTVESLADTASIHQVHSRYWGRATNQKKSAQNLIQMSFPWLTEAYAGNSPLHHLYNSHHSIIVSRGWVAIETELEGCKKKRKNNLPAFYFQDCGSSTLQACCSEVLCKSHDVGSQRVQRCFCTWKSTSIQLRSFRTLKSHHTVAGSTWWSNKLSGTKYLTLNWPQSKEKRWNDV